MEAYNTTELKKETIIVILNRTEEEIKQSYDPFLKNNKENNEILVIVNQYISNSLKKYLKETMQKHYISNINQYYSTISIVDFTFL